MTTSLKNFGQGQLTASEVTLVSSTSSEKKFMGAIQIFNTSTSNIEITFWLMLTATTGTTGVGGNQKYVRTIPAGTSRTIMDFQGQVIDNSMKFSGLASTTAVVNYPISGTTET